MDTWVAWTLSSGALHVTDASNAAVTGLRTPNGDDWDPRVMEVLKIPERVLPQVVDSSGPIGEASALDGAPQICGILGDQQASLVGQGCTLPGLAKITFGTGGFLDSLCRCSTDPRSPAGGSVARFRSRPGNAADGSPGGSRR